MVGEQDFQSEAYRIETLRSEENCMSKSQFCLERILPYKITSTPTAS